MRALKHHTRPCANALARELKHLPALFDAVRSGSPAALADCRHQFFTESMSTPRVLGPCRACGKVESDVYKQGFTRCLICNGVRCKPCAADSTIVQDQQQSFLQAYHEVNNSHTWEVCRRECDLCGKGPCGCGGKHCDDNDNDATAGSPTQPHRGKLLALPPASLQQPAAPSPATVAAVAKHAVSNASCSQVAA